MMRFFEIKKLSKTLYISLIPILLFCLFFLFSTENVEFTASFIEVTIMIFQAFFLNKIFLIPFFGVSCLFLLWFNVLYQHKEKIKGVLLDKRNKNYVFWVTLILFCIVFFYQLSWLKEKSIDLSINAENFYPFLFSIISILILIITAYYLWKSSTATDKQIKLTRETIDNSTFPLLDFKSNRIHLILDFKNYILDSNQKEFEVNKMIARNNGNSPGISTRLQLYTENAKPDPYSISLIGIISKEKEFDCVKLHEYIRIEFKKISLKLSYLLGDRESFEDKLLNSFRILNRVFFLNVNSVLFAIEGYFEMINIKYDPPFEKQKSVETGKIEFTFELIYFVDRIDRIYDEDDMNE